MSNTTTAEQTSSSLTKYPSASLRELISLSLPLILVLLSGCLMNFCNRFFLAKSSLDAFAGSVNALYICMLFQIPFMRITSMSQIFVGFHKGAKNPQLIGPCVWQMLWFSILSMIITVPLSGYVGHLFLGGTTIEKPALTYYNLLVSVNFLFPMVTALSSFYIAEGKTKILIVTTVIVHAINILLDYVLIFGVEGLIPPLGILGAAIATVVAQACFFVILFTIFLKKENREVYHSHLYALKLKSFLNYIRVGMPRAGAKLVLLCAWAFTARIMNMRAGDCILVLSVGSTLFLLLGFINEGMGQAMMTIASRLIGAKEYSLLRKLRRTAFIYLAGTMALVSIPLVLFPEFALNLFVKEPVSEATWAILKRTCFWIWFVIFANGFNMIGFSLISASCNTVFHMTANCFVWLTQYLPILFVIKIWNSSPDLFWLLIAFDGFVIGLSFHWKAYRNELKHTSFEKCHATLQ
jgi:MATE family multidrug resistance protein